MDKRTVLLFGAGAAIPWGGPSTTELTSTVIQSGRSFRTKEGIPVTELVNQNLKKTGLDDYEINFETIISVVEDLIIYYGYIDGPRRVQSISRCFFSSMFGDQSWDFTISGGEEKHGYSLEIPSHSEYEFYKVSLNYENPTQFYFQHLLAEILTNIAAKISRYSFRRKAEMRVGPYKELNSLFMNWYRKLTSMGVVRMYTLNYDRNFKTLAKQTGSEIFEGFQQPTGELEDQKLDLYKISTDVDVPIHYNLHGSTHWKVHARDQYTQLHNPWISLSPFHTFELNSSESTVVQVDRGRNFLVSNIISGYQKSQKSLVSPFRQMQAAFDRDCMVADELFIIGYSLGDFHINSSIVNAIRANNKIKIHLIDPAYKGKQGYDLLVDRKIKILSDLLHFKRTDCVYFNNRNTCSYFEDKLRVTSTGFVDFLRFS